MSTLLLIPWIIYGYRHPEKRFLGLCQTKRTLLILLGIEIVYWFVLAMIVGKQEVATTGSGSFAWRFILFYEKGIIPIWVVAETLDPKLGDKIESDFKILYLLAALIMDYIFLFILSPRVPQLFKKKDPKTFEGRKHAANKSSSNPKN
jgi:hypothetical protein